MRTVKFETFDERGEIITVDVNLEVKDGKTFLIGYNLPALSKVWFYYSMFKTKLFSLGVNSDGNTELRTMAPEAQHSITEEGLDKIEIQFIPYQEP